MYLNETALFKLEEFAHKKIKQPQVNLNYI